MWEQIIKDAKRDDQACIRFPNIGLQNHEIIFTKDSN